MEYGHGRWNPETECQSRPCHKEEKHNPSPEVTRTKKRVRHKPIQTKIHFLKLLQSKCLGIGNYGKNQITTLGK